MRRGKMLDMTLIKERQEEARHSPDTLIQGLAVDIDDLMEEIEKTPWRVRELIGTGRIASGLFVKTPFLRLCYLMDRAGKLSMAIVSLDELMIELLLAEIAAFCMGWMKELEHARPEAD
jgi:hypothetical protein